MSARRSRVKAPWFSPCWLWKTSWWKSQNLPSRCLCDAHGCRGVDGLLAQEGEVPVGEEDGAIRHRAGDEEWLDGRGIAAAGGALRVLEDIDLHGCVRVAQAASMAQIGRRRRRVGS